jgi:hypothetical protein
LRALRQKARRQIGKSRMPAQGQTYRAATHERVSRHADASENQTADASDTQTEPHIADASEQA